MSAVLLLSGGMDSTALAAWKRPSACVTVDYGQQAAAAELKAATLVGELLGLPCARSGRPGTAWTRHPGRTGRQSPLRASGVLAVPEPVPHHDRGRHGRCRTTLTRYGPAPSAPTTATWTDPHPSTAPSTPWSDFRKAASASSRPRSTWTPPNSSTNRSRDEVLSWTHSCHRADIFLRPMRRMPQTTQHPGTARAPAVSGPAVHRRADLPALAAAAAFLGCIVASNVFIAHVGTSRGAGQRRAIPVGFGLSTPSGALLAGASSRCAMRCSIVSPYGSPWPSSPAVLC